MRAPLVDNLRGNFLPREGGWGNYRLLLPKSWPGNSAAVVGWRPPYGQSMLTQLYTMVRIVFDG